MKGERHFEYDLTFEGPQYTVRHPMYFNADITGFNTSSDFLLTGPQLRATECTFNKKDFDFRFSLLVFSTEAAT